MRDALEAYLVAAPPRDVVHRLGRLTRGRPAPDVELWLGAGGWVRGRLIDLDARGEAAVLLGDEGEALYVRLEDVRACRVHDAVGVLDLLSHGRYEPIEPAARAPETTQAALQELAATLSDNFGIRLQVDLGDAPDAPTRQSVLSAARTLVEALDGLGAEREVAGALARRLDEAAVVAGHRPNVRLERRRLLYVVDPEEGPPGRLSPERLRRNVQSVLDD